MAPPAVALSQALMRDNTNVATHRNLSRDYPRSGPNSSISSDGSHIIILRVAETEMMMMMMMTSPLASLLVSPSSCPADCSFSTGARPEAASDRWLGPGPRPGLVVRPLALEADARQVRTPQS